MAKVAFMTTRFPNLGPLIVLTLWTQSRKALTRKLLDQEALQPVRPPYAECRSLESPV